MPSPPFNSAREHQSGTLVLTRADVGALLRVADCIPAVEDAFRRHADGGAIPPGVLGAHVSGGGFHVKTAGLLAAGADGRSVFATKINANFPGNPDRHGLPTIQGIVALFDVSDGCVLALMDSGEITSVRTAAATAVAAKYLAREDAASVTICGCGEQSRSQLRALSCVRPIRSVMAFDLNADRAARFARDMTNELGVDVRPVRGLGSDTRDADIWVTCTPARGWYLGRAHVRQGTFIAAVGADNPEKQEIEPELLASSTVVADILDQCAAIGDLHHALESGAMRREQVHAELSEIVAGWKRGRTSPDEITVFDSTGTALQDVAAAMLVYESALSSGQGMAIDLSGSSGSARSPSASVVT